MEGGSRQNKVESNDDVETNEFEEKQEMEDLNNNAVDICPKTCTYNAMIGENISHEVKVLQIGEINNKKFRKNVSKKRRKHNKYKEDVLIEKKPRMKTAREVINRIKWDNQINAEDISVKYLDRHVGMIKKTFNDLNWADDIASTGPDDVLVLPEHRIYTFLWKSKVIWDREKRVDRVFGSTGGKKTIYDVINESDQANDDNQQQESPNTITDTVRNDESLSISVSDNDLNQKEDVIFNSQEISEIMRDPFLNLMTQSS